MKEIFTKERVRRMALYGIYMFVTLILQTMFLSQLRPLGVCPLFLPAAVVAVGMFEGVTWGAIFGMIMGIYADLAFVESSVAFTLLFPAIAFAVGFVSQFFLNRQFLAYIVAAFGALLVTGVVQMIRIIAMNGFSVSAVETAVLQAVFALPMAVLLYFPPAKWIE